MIAADQPNRILIRGGRVYDHDGDVHQPAVADVLIANGRIERIAPRIAPEPGVEVIEAAGKLAAPGFVNAHYHSHDVMLKGMFEEMPFDIWAIHSNAASYGVRSHREMRVRTLIGAAEMLKNGITTVQDFLTLVPAQGEYLDTILSAYAEAGIRVVIGLAARDRAALDILPLMGKELPETLRARLIGASRPAKDDLDFIAGQMARLGKNPRPLTTWAITPSAPQRCSPELLEGLAALSRQHDLPVFTHVYETRPQAAAARVQSASLLDLLVDAGLMNDRLNLVHGVWLAPSDIAMLAEHSARVVHNPISNLKLKSGVAPILELDRAGVPVALGCDNYSCAETQNIFVAMRMLCLLPAVTSPEPHPISAARALRAATLNGAKCCGLDGVAGALKEGMAADLMILDLNEPSFVPFNSAARQIVFAEGGRAVDTVLVGGRVVLRDGKLATVDEAALAAEAAELSPSLRREVEALAMKNADLIPPLLEGNRAAWQVPLGFDRYVGRGKV
jgi:cytosine/adenosine deaminase-related metal-dependent hydrolase